jgi:uncharacterized protein (TIRG00374 family)
MLMGLLLYGAFVVWRDTRKIAHVLEGFQWWSFGAACSFAFCNYVLRYFKWEFYLARLDIRGVKKSDSFLTFLSGFVLTVTPGKVGEVFKSLVLYETYKVPMPKTAPIVIAERVTDVIGIVILIVIGSLGFKGGLMWAGIGAALVVMLLVVIANRKLSLALIGVVERMPGKLGKIGPKLHSSYDSLATMLKIQNLFLPTLLSLAAWFFECMSLFIILRGFGQSTSIPLCTFFYATSTLVGALVPVPGGLGVTEGTLMGQLTEMGHVNEAVATSAMILVRFATLWFAVLVGFVALSIMKRVHPGLLAGEEAPEVAGNT